MGYFNFWYNLKYFFRRMPKKILVFICIFLIICVLHLSGYCTTVTNIPNADYFQYIKFIYEQDWYSLTRLEIEYAKNHNNTFEQYFALFCNRITEQQDRMSWYVTHDFTSIHFVNNQNLPVINLPETFTFGYDFDDANTYDYSDYFIYPGSHNSTSSTGKQWSLVKSSHYYNRVWAITHNANGITTHDFLQCYINYPEGLQKYIPVDLYTTIYNIGHGSFNFTTSDELLADIDNKVNTLNDNINDLNEFIQDDTISNYSSSDLPSDSMIDITSSGFNNIFTRIYNAFTDSSSNNVSITIPYLNYVVTVNNNFVFSALYRNGFSTVLTFIEAIWYGVISLYILKDIYKYINQIKNGDIGHTDTNIKTEVL